MDFKETESKYFELKGRLDAGALTPEQFHAEVGELRVQDDEGRYWTIDARSGGWLLWEGSKWLESQPPGVVSAPPPTPAPAPGPRRGPGPVLLIGALAVAAVLCLVSLGGAGLILTRSGGPSGVEEPAAVGQQEAERIADDLVAQEFPDLVDAEKTMGSYENPAGTQFWTITYREDKEGEFEGVTSEIPYLVIVSVDKDTGEAIAAVSG